jgi:phosphoribosylaminoimidazolecarboxamide formyltransferase / IMP cyclohydrolase
MPGKIADKWKKSRNFIDKFIILLYAEEFMKVKIRRALISVSDKSGITALAADLVKMGVEIISTGGTYNKIKEAGIGVRKIDEVTGFPEMMEGRVKTLHPAVHGGILADRKKESHMKEIESAGISPIDMVVVNLYPFKETVSAPGVKYEDAVENIDIGGPTMIRSAAKNHQSVAVVVDPSDYSKILAEMKENEGTLSTETLYRLAVKAFQHTCEYDSVIFDYLYGRIDGYLNTEISISPGLNIETGISEGYTGKYKDEKGGFKKDIALSFTKIQDLRYGENPHQKASYYSSLPSNAGSLVSARQLQGKELSYNNILDTNAAFQIVKEFKEPCVAVIKHNNPCGAAIGSSIAEAYKKAYECDPVSAFGSVVASNMRWTAEAAEFLSDKYVEVLIAPEFDGEALKIHSDKKNLRILNIDFDVESNVSRLQKKDFATNFVDIKSVDGGILVQELDEGIDDRDKFRVVTRKKPTDQQQEDLIFGWQIAKSVKSNAIVLVKDKATVGVGAGQMSRVDAAKIAIDKSSGRCNKSVLASDAFLPFKDVVDMAAASGILSIIQPGGSVRDEEVIEACNDKGISMIFTGKRHFRH